MDKQFNTNPNLKWYMVTTISGKEEKVIESLKNVAISENLENAFFWEKAVDRDLMAEDFAGAFKIMNIPHIAPKELEKRSRGEDFAVKTKNLLPGYIFIRMEMTNEAWFKVRNAQYVTGLVGSSGQRAKPTPVSDRELRGFERKVAKQWEDFNAGKIASPFVPGTLVEIIDGPAKGQSGVVVESNDDRQVAVVEIILFERKTPTEIEHKNLKVKE